MRSAAREAVVLLLALAVLLGQAGCGGRAVQPRQLSEQEWQQLGVVGVVNVEYPAGYEFVMPEAGAAGGMSRGMAKGALTGAGAILQGGLACAHWACLIVVPAAAAAAAVVGGLIGAVVGGVQAPDKKQVREAEETIRRCLCETYHEEDFGETLLSEAGNWSMVVEVPAALSRPSSPEDTVDYRPLGDEGIDTVLEAEVLGFGFSGSEIEIDPPLALTASARVRLVRVHNNTPVYDEILSAAGQRQKKFLEWAEDDGRALREEVGHVCSMLAATIVERIFLVSVPWTVSDAAKIAVAPLKFVEPDLGPYLGAPVVESLRPTLKWESFPRPADMELDREGLLADAEEIVYELSIWSFGWSAATGRRQQTGLVYHRDGLAAPAHAVEEPLEPSAEYFASVTAWYKVLDQLWATPEGIGFFRTPEN